MFRYLVGIPVSVGITLSLFFLMRFLVTGEFKEPEEQIAASKIEIAREVRDETTRTIDDQEAPEKLDTPPPPPMIDQSFDPPEQNTPKIDLSAMTGGNMDLNNVMGDVEVQPLVRVEPQFPPNALSRCMEGFAIVEYTVTSTGDVTDPVIVESGPNDTRVWDRNVKRAVVKWKFRPRMQDGEPVDFRNRTTVRFPKPEGCR